MTCQSKGFWMTSHDKSEPTSTATFSNISIECFECIYLFRVPSHLGKGLSQYPGGLLPGAAQDTVDEPFKR